MKPLPKPAVSSTPSIAQNIFSPPDQLPTLSPNPVSVSPQQAPREILRQLPESSPAPANSTTAHLLVDTLADYGVSHIFGVPGGAIEDLNTALYESRRITPIVAKHEEGAAFMADGFARVSGRLGVCCSTAGPGASNLITGIATAHADNIPVLALTGQVATSVFGKGAIQESGAEGVNMTGVFRNFTKYSGMVISEQRALYMIQKAVRLATSGPSGAVHLNLPTDIMKRRVCAENTKLRSSELRLFDRNGVKRAAAALAKARRPVLLAGWGVVLSRGARELFELAELLGIPVATSPKAKGVFPESHPLSLGVLGFAGSGVAKEYITENDIDVLVGVGTSFNEMMTGGWDERLSPTDHLIHIDVDAEEIGKNYDTSIGLCGDARTVLKEICFALERLEPCQKPGLHSRSAAEKEIAGLRIKHVMNGHRQPAREGFYHPMDLVLDLQKSCSLDTIWFADIGNIMAWAIRHMIIDRAYSFFVPLGFGSMGYAVAAPVGAQLAFPDRPMVTLVGDGGFLMNGFEVATAVNYGIPVVWVVFNNGMLGMVHHGRKLFSTPVPEGIPSSFQRVDFAKIAEGLGARGIRVDGRTPVSRELMEDIFASGRPTVLDVQIDEMVVPPIHSRISTVDKHFR